MSAFRSALKLVGLKRPLIGLVICPVVEPAGNSTRRYSARTVQRGAMANSIPPPIVQPIFSSVKELKPFGFPSVTLST
jgi:hypothetical protein